MANGNFGGGIGTELDPFLIEDAADLNEIRNNLTSAFKIISNIDLDIPPYNQGEGWVPIVGFSGILDGGSKKIKNLIINRPLEDGQGLFGSITNATIKSLELNNFNISGKVSCGCLSGSGTSNLIIENIVVKDCTVSGESQVGGLMGIKTAASSNIPVNVLRNIKVQGQISGTGSNIAGIVGILKGTAGLYHPIVNAIYIGDIEGILSIDLTANRENFTAGPFYNVFGVSNNSSNIASVGSRITSIEAIDPNYFSSLANYPWDLEQDNGYYSWNLYAGHYPLLRFETTLYRFLFKSGTKIYTINGNNPYETSLIDPPSLENFLEIGAPFILIEEISKIPNYPFIEVLVYSENGSPQYLNGKYDKFIDSIEGSQRMITDGYVSEFEIQNTDFSNFYNLSGSFGG